MKVAYFVSKGASDPTGASIPIHLAVNGSVELGQEVSLVLGGDAAELLDPKVRDSLEGVGLPPMKELMEKVRDKGLAVYV